MGIRGAGSFPFSCSQARGAAKPNSNYILDSRLLDEQKFKSKEQKCKKYATELAMVFDQRLRGH
jgi:hypothetical protein